MNILAQAQHFLDCYWNFSVPVPIHHMAVNNGIVVQHKTLTNGLIAQTNNKNHILIDIHQPLIVQRFALAHQIGHIWLGHGDNLTETKDNFSKNCSIKIETDANQFAMAVLMPSEAIEHCIHHEQLTVQEMANKFKISSLAMETRLQQLGFL